MEFTQNSADWLMRESVPGNVVRAEVHGHEQFGAPQNMPGIQEICELASDVFSLDGVFSYGDYDTLPSLDTDAYACSDAIMDVVSSDIESVTTFVGQLAEEDLIHFRHFSTDLGCMCGDGLSLLGQALVTLCDKAWSSWRSVYPDRTDCVRLTIQPHRVAPVVTNLNGSCPTLPYCGRCSADVFAYRAKRGYKAVCLVPDYCSACSSGGQLVLASTGDVKCSPMEIHLSNQEYRTLSVAVAFNANQPKCDAQNRLIALMDKKGDEGFTRRELFLIQHLGYISQLRGVPVIRSPHTFLKYLPGYSFYHAHFREHVQDERMTSKNWCGEFYPFSQAETDVTREEIDENANLEQTIRSVELDLDENDKRVPEIVVVEADDSVFHELTGKNVNQDLIVAMQECSGDYAHLETLPPYFEMPPGVSAKAVRTERGRACGPQLFPAYVYNRKAPLNKVAAVQGRTRPKEKYHASSEPAKGFRKFWNALSENVFTKEAIEDSISDLDPDITQIVRKKFSEKELNRVNDYLTLCGAPASEQQELYRQYTVKYEVVNKPGKYPRGIIDEGAYNLVLNSILGHVINKVVFEGPLGRLSIKHQDKSKMMTEFLSNLRTMFPDEQLSGMEVDQTGMELHERIDNDGSGLMAGIMTVIQKILRVIDGRFHNPHGDAISFKYKDERKRGMRIKINLGVGGVFTMSYNDWFMTSGWLLTSVVNFLNELAATMSCMASNPHKLLAVNKKTGKLYLDEGTHDFKFTSLFENGRQFYWFGKVEGDDLAASISRWMTQYIGDIERNYALLGMSSKLKFMNSGRLEFVGLHSEIEDGRPTGRYIPDLKRTLTKIGTCTLSSATNPHTAMASRFQSLGYMFAGSIGSVADMFMNLAEEHNAIAMANKEENLVCIDTHADTTILNVLDTDFEEQQDRIRKVRMSCLSESIKSRIQAASELTMDEQVALVSMSLEEEVTYDEMLEFASLLRSLTVETRISEVLNRLPKAILKAMRKAYGVA